MNKIEYTLSKFKKNCKEHGLAYALKEDGKEFGRRVKRLAVGAGLVGLLLAPSGAGAEKKCSDYRWQELAGGCRRNYTCLVGERGDTLPKLAKKHLKDAQAYKDKKKMYVNVTYNLNLFPSGKSLELSSGDIVCIKKSEYERKNNIKTQDEKKKKAKNLKRKLLPSLEKIMKKHSHLAARYGWQHVRYGGKAKKILGYNPLLRANQHMAKASYLHLEMLKMKLTYLKANRVAASYPTDLHNKTVSGTFGEERCQRERKKRISGLEKQLAKAKRYKIKYQEHRKLNDKYIQEMKKALKTLRKYKCQGWATGKISVPPKVKLHPSLSPNRLRIDNPIPEKIEIPDDKGAI